MLHIREFERSIGLKSFLFILLLLLSVIARAPKDIPGDEVSEEDYLKFKTSKDTVLNKIPKDSPENDLWYDRASQTWLSPSIADQLDASESSLKVGMGGVFVPYMSDPEIEPEIDIVDTEGKIVRRGKCGLIYSVLPGEYSVNVGSGSKNQRIIKKITVQEGKIKVIRPDWAAISIKIINENNRVIRGEYEIARIDTFNSFGRGTGNDPSLGEKLNTWILRPGLYKIFNVGASYNSLKNFTTVRLRPGRYISYTLVQDESRDGEIIGGGAVDVQISQKRNSNWSYGINIGGGVDLQYQNDREFPDDTSKNINELDFSLLFESNLTYSKEKINWNGGLRLDEGIKITDFDFNDPASSTDEMRLTSIFIWQLLPILGPYQRIESDMNILPTSVKRAESTQKHYYVVLDKDSTLNMIDSTDKESFRIKPSFSDILFETGLGVNANILRTRVLDVSLLGGLGLTYEQNRDAYNVEKNNIIDSAKLGSDFTLLNSIITNENHHVLIKASSDRIEYGPEFLIKTLLRLGVFASISSELKIFSPFGRAEVNGSSFRPDISFTNNLSWRLISQLTLDYRLGYYLKQPDEKPLREDKVSHRVLLRFSFSRR